MTSSGYPERITAAIGKLERGAFPLTIELAGLPRSGKTTCSKSLDDLFRLRTEFVFGKIAETAFHSCLSGPRTSTFNR